MLVGLQMNQSSVPFSSLELWHLVREMPRYPTASQHSSQAKQGSPSSHRSELTLLPAALFFPALLPFRTVLAHYFCFSRSPVEVGSCHLSKRTHASPPASPHLPRAQVPVLCIAVLSSFLEWDVSQCQVPEGINVSQENSLYRLRRQQKSQTWKAFFTAYRFTRKPSCTQNPI